MKDDYIEEYNEDLDSEFWDIKINTKIIENVKEWIRCNESWIQFYKNEKNYHQSHDKIELKMRYIKYWENMLDIENIKNRIVELQIEIRKSLEKYGEAYYDLFWSPLPDEVIEYRRLIDLKNDEKHRDIRLKPIYPSAYHIIKGDKNDN